MVWPDLHSFHAIFSRRLSKMHMTLVTFLNVNQQLDGGIDPIWIPSLLKNGRIKAKFSDVEI